MIELIETVRAFTSQFMADEINQIAMGIGALLAICAVFPAAFK